MDDHVHLWGVLERSRLGGTVHRHCTVEDCQFINAYDDDVYDETYLTVVTIPAFAADTLDESLELEAPAEWHDRIRALAPYCCYGPDYNRAVIYSLRELSRSVVDGYTTAAYDRLLDAERRVGISPPGE